MNARRIAKQSFYSAKALSQSGNSHPINSVKFSQNTGVLTALLLALKEKKKTGQVSNFNN